MQPEVYTHARWLVRPGEEQAFIERWSALAESFSRLDRKPLWGTLIRSVDDRRLFYSFGPWLSREDVTAMRADPAAQAAMRELIALCEEATPSMFELVQHVDV